MFDSGESPVQPYLQLISFYVFKYDFYSFMVPPFFFFPPTSLLLRLFLILFLSLFICQYMFVLFNLALQYVICLQNYVVIKK